MSTCLDFVQIADTRLEIASGDITTEEVDAIVNAANAYLQHGGGVAGAIVRKGGQAVQQESEQWIQQHGRVEHAHPAYTSGGKLPCKYVLHAVGPIWGEGNEDKKLADAVYGSLELAVQLQISSLAFPAISTGIYGFPKGRAARIILQTQTDWLTSHPDSPLRLVRNVLFDEATRQVYIVEFSNLKK
jgi:O-acetyl-ADP-ribose deacetylase